MKIVGASCLSQFDLGFKGFDFKTLSLSCATTVWMTIDQPNSIIK